MAMQTDNPEPRERTPPDAETVFCPADYSDIVSFKAGYAAAYAESLRQSDLAPLIRGHDSLTHEQLGAIIAVRGDRVRAEKRGSGNFLVAVRSSFHGKACGSLKRHFIGCERQLIGLAELMAAKDAERFVWITIKSWQKHAKKRDGNVYCRSYIWHRLQILESWGLLVPARKYRSRTWRKGFLVTKHGDVAHIEGEHCVLTITKRKISPRRPGEKRVG